MFVAYDLEANADFITARDFHLRHLKHFQGIQSVSVTTFQEKVKGK